MECSSLALERLPKGHLCPTASACNGAPSLTTKKMCFVFLDCLSAVQWEHDPLPDTVLQAHRAGGVYLECHYQNSINHTESIKKELFSVSNRPLKAQGLSLIMSSIVITMSSEEVTQSNLMSLWFCQLCNWLALAIGAYPG